MQVQDEGASAVEGKSVVLVTVGSTKFEDLLEVVDSAAFVEAVVARGYEALVVQYGPHAAHAPLHLPRLAKEHGLAYQAFAMSSSFASVLAQAALVISHAGSGTILEGLSIGKKMVVVVNDKLMDNHQMEIASVMGQAKHVFDTTPNQLLALLGQADFDQLRPLPPPDTSAFAHFVDSLF
ncbi:glycosyltransferase family 28 Cterminal domain containing protein [Acanthamoeba castellanii str. Neff]|uniref:UDP-N-acetylglucosamine transferase subunit ALG13 n=1 Tax=Acanthamoeba castellanii (strain ATCC 30010 / Neff) TaxID=1257118 RepID=L8H2P7_ACACF|nr:glycosyltransferase family 28 Cterminal domain containing protein [Acanthamoeba castellanii str. Neff]ELR18641.1 glycosyltransferase family 28 Cterminal domain containing protein [Acanthamoeba castellanii str. Neff]